MAVLALVVLAAGLVGCTTEPEFNDAVIPLARDFELTEADDGTAVEMEVGQRFAVQLDVAFGDRWEWAAEEAAKAGEPFPVKLLASDYVALEGDQAPTDPRKWEMVFEVVADGSELLVFEEFSSDDERTGRQWSFTVVVGEEAKAARTPRTDPFGVEAIAIVRGLEEARTPDDEGGSGDLAAYRESLSDEADALSALLERAEALKAEGDDAEVKADLVYVLDLEVAMAKERLRVAEGASTMDAAQPPPEVLLEPFEDQLGESTERYVAVLVALGLDG